MSGARSEYLFHSPSLGIYKIDKGVGNAIEHYFSAPFHSPDKEYEADLETLRKASLLDSMDETDGTETERPLNPIRSLTLFTNASCDLRCSYCYISQNNNFNGSSSGSMSIATALRSLDYFVSAGSTVDSIAVNFFGGEPLLSFETIQGVVEYLAPFQQSNRLRVTYTLTTNGYSLSPEIARFLIRNNIHTHVSIDGTEYNHDKNRITAAGKGSYSTIVGNIAPILDKRPDLLTVRATITPENCDFISIDKNFTQLGILHYGFEPVTGKNSSGRSFWNENLFHKFEQGYKAYARYLYDLIINGTVSGHGLIFVFSRLRQLHNRLPTIFTCRMGRELAVVAPDGRIYPCYWFVGMKNYCIGTVFDGLDEQRRSALIPGPVISKRSCRDCWARRLCDGGCPAVSIIERGSDEYVDQWMCRERRIKWEYTLLMYIKLLESAFDFNCIDSVFSRRNSGDTAAYV